MNGSSENGPAVVSEPSIALTGAVSAARLWRTDSRGVRGYSAIADGKFATGAIPIPTGYSGLTLTAVDFVGSVASRIVGIVSAYQPSEPPVFEADILPVRPAAAGKIGNECQGLAIQYPDGLWSRCSAPGSLDTSLFRLRRPAESNLAWLEPAICTPVSGPATARCTSR